MKTICRVLLVSILMLGVIAPQHATAQSVSTEERFQDLFTTAGYATAFGAAMGAAFLSFHKNPENHLRYIAVGASLGFIGGSLLGTYFIFAPTMLGEETIREDRDLLAGVPANGILVRPVYNTDTKRLGSIEAGLTLLNF